MREPDQMRAEFESAMAATGYRNFCKNERGQYILSDIAGMWDGWQLCVNTRAKQAGAGDAWQPIETAPKDEAEYLLADWRTSDGFMQVCYWDDAHADFPWRVKDATGYSAAFFTHWKRLSDEICSTPQPEQVMHRDTEINAAIFSDVESLYETDTTHPQPEPKALEPVADPIGIENIVVHEVCCCGECKPNERTIGVVSKDEYKAVFDMWQFQKKSHVDKLNQARVEVAGQCEKICRDLRERKGNEAFAAEYCANRIKQLADQMRGGE
jgi:hypothetical protein